MDRRVDLAVGRLEAEALARSFGLTRSTRFINVLDAARHLQDAKGQRRAVGRRRWLRHRIRSADLRFRQGARRAKPSSAISKR